MLKFISYGELVLTKVKMVEHYASILIWLLLLLHINANAQMMCLEPDTLIKGNKTVEFSVKSHQNQTGHSTTRFQINGEAHQPQKNWKIELKHSTSDYGGMYSFYIRGSLTVPPPKPTDYELFPGIGYYKFHYGSKLTFQEASSACIREGGHLVILNSEEESRVIKTIYARHPKDGGPWSFIGFYDRNKSRDFVTIFGQSLKDTGFYTWHPTEPNNVGGAQFCGCVLQDGLLADVGCDDRLSFFCEYDHSWSEQ